MPSHCSSLKTLGLEADAGLSSRLRSSEFLLWQPKFALFRRGVQGTVPKKRGDGRRRRATRGVRGDPRGGDISRAVACRPFRNACVTCSVQSRQPGAIVNIPKRFPSAGGVKTAKSGHAETLRFPWTCPAPPPKLPGTRNFGTSVNSPDLT